MENENEIRGCHNMKLWKWILAFVFGSFAMVFAMSFAEALPILLNKYPALAFVASIFGGCGLLGLYTLWVCLVEKRPAYELNIYKAPKNLGLGMGVGFLMFCVLTAILMLIGYYKVASVGFPVQKILAQFGFFFVVAVGEELVFRGFIFRMIDQRFNLWVALIVSALIFGLVHYTNPNGTLWSSIAIAIEAGLMLAMAYKCTDGLWFPIGIHWTWNFTQGNIFGFAVSGNNAGNTIIQPIVSGPDLITGGEFGPEASINAAVIGLLIAAWFYKIYKDKTKKSL